MRKLPEDEWKNITVLNDRITLASALRPARASEPDALAGAIVEPMEKE